MPNSKVCITRLKSKVLVLFCQTKNKAANLKHTVCYFLQASLYENNENNVVK